MAGKYSSCFVILFFCVSIFSSGIIYGEKRGDDDIDLQSKIEKLRSESRSPKDTAREKKLAELCSILSVSSKWKDLRDESAYGIKHFRAGKLYHEFSIHYITSSILTGKYSEAFNECGLLLESNHDSRVIVRALILKSYIISKTEGFSREYLVSLKQLSDGFLDTESAPAIIMMYAQYHEKKNNSNAAYAAYLDLKKKYPRSVEAIAAAEKIEKLKKNVTAMVDYIPDTSALSSAERIDISPEIDNGEHNSAGRYSVAIGPFAKRKEAQQMKKIATQFGASRIVRLNGAYIVYAGNFDDSESALEARVRLAEEFGVNGNIVKFKSSDTKEYIYGEE